MKIYAVSDMHGELSGLEIPKDCETVVVAGDFSKMYGFGKWHMYKQKKWIENKFFDWTSSYPEKDFVIIAGNHDLCLDHTRTNAYRDIDWHIGWPSNVRYLENSSCIIGGFRFYGTPNIPLINRMWAFEKEDYELKEIFGSIPLNTDVLVTHTPPRIPSCDVDVSLQNGRGPFGCPYLAQAIFEKHPTTVFCGHIHSGSHKRTEFESSVIYNVSRVDELYEIEYEPRIVEI